MSRYNLWVIPQAWKEMKGLPGNVRHRIREAVGELAKNPRPSTSKKLTVEDFDREARRIRIDRWRIVYVVTEEEKIVDVLAVRKRPPYDYRDLQNLLREMR